MGLPSGSREGPAGREAALRCWLGLVLVLMVPQKTNQPAGNAFHATSALLARR